MKGIGRIKTVGLTLISIVTLLTVGVGMRRAMKSPHFTLETIEIETEPEERPLSLTDEAIIKLTGIPVGKISLYELDLPAVERRLLSNEWIREVRLQKGFLHRLLIRLKFREPVAIAQNSRGKLMYVDSEGHIFGTVNLLTFRDLPLLSGFEKEPSTRIKKALQLVNQWETSPAGRISQLSSVYWESDRGYRILVSYPLKTARRAKSELSTSIEEKQLMRTIIDLGDSESEAQWAPNFRRLSKVFAYLGERSIASRRIWADRSGKKIVVKTQSGS